MPVTLEGMTELSGDLADTDVLHVSDVDAASDPHDRKVTVDALHNQLGIPYVITAADPTVNDDSADGYRVGHTWLNTSDGGLFLCTDNSAGAAVWAEFSFV